MGQPQSQPAGNFQMPPTAGAMQQGGAQMQGQPWQGGMPNDVQGQPGAQNAGSTSTQDGAQAQSQHPAGPRGLFSQAPDPGHSPDEK